MEPIQKQVNKSHYFDEKYNSKARWVSFFYQIEILQDIKAKKVLEIGPGNGLVTYILRDRGVQVTTVDIDPDLKPDVVASVSKLPLADNTFDAVCAFEVLEHIPFEHFVKNLKEMSRISKKHVVISLPDRRRILLHFLLKVPLINYKNIFIKIPSFKKHVFDGQHYWEIGKKGYSVGFIKEHIEKAGLKIIKDFVHFDAPGSHYFILEK
ncbi:MAG: methyltransferase domain-containing protein [Parcubacteria group bacterium]|nr:methyltransferase domain-containing protein [Parcubacteria group bacterium]